MKRIKSILALALAIMIVLALSATALAAEGDVTITIIRDDSYVTNPTDGQTNVHGNRPYTYYQVFRATYADGFTQNDIDADAYNAETGELSNIPTGGTGVAYYLDATADAAVIAKFSAADNVWFKLTPSGDGSRYNVSWIGEDSTAETVQAASQWIVDNRAYVTSGSINPYRDWKNGRVTITVPKGYYVIDNAASTNLIAVTADVTVYEKNAYPIIDLKEKDEDLDAYTNGQTENNEQVYVAVGDVIDYQLTVWVPFDAEASHYLNNTNYPQCDGFALSGTLYSGSWDYCGLTMDPDSFVFTSSKDGVTLVEGEDYRIDYKTPSTGSWRVVLYLNEKTQGTTVTITYSATVNTTALNNDGKRVATVDLRWDMGNDITYGMHDHADYETHFTGIEKVDGNTPTKKLEGVKFTLQEDGVDFKVTQGSETDKNGNVFSFYYPDANGSATVVTDADGLIRIRGLDKDKTYTLIETETNAGYNLMTDPVTLGTGAYPLQLEKVDREWIPIPAGPYEEAEIKVVETNRYRVENYGDVLNFSGTVLPNTGGIGTTIFYVIGGIMVLAAGVLLITKKRLSQVED